MNKIALISRYNHLSIQSKASLWALFAGIVQKGISVLSTPIFTRILSTSEYAQYALYQSWQDIFIIFASLNVFNYATYTAMSKYENDRESFIVSAQSLVTVLCIVSGIIISVLNLVTNNFLGFPFYIIILLFADILFISSYNLWAARKRFQYEYKIMTILSVLIGILRPIIGIVLIHFVAERGFARIYGVASVNICLGIILYCVNIRAANKLFDIKYWNYIIKFCLPLVPHFLASQILSRFDRIMIGKMCVDTQVSIYSLAYNLSTLMIILSDAVLTSITPWMYQSIKEDKWGKIKKISNSVILLVCAGNLILMLFAPELIYIFAPSEYYEAIYIIPSVSASVFFIFLFNIFANIEYYYSETKYVAVASCGAAVLNVILNYIFIGAYGYIAAGYTTLVCYIVYSLSHFLFMRLVSKKHANGYNFFDNRFIFVIAIIFTMISLAIIPLYNYYVIRYVLIAMFLLALFIKRKTVIEILNKSKG